MVVVSNYAFHLRIPEITWFANAPWASSPCNTIDLLAKVCLGITCLANGVPFVAVSKFFSFLKKAVLSRRENAALTIHCCTHVSKIWWMHRKNRSVVAPAELLSSKTCYFEFVCIQCWCDCFTWQCTSCFSSSPFLRCLFNALLLPGLFDKEKCHKPMQ